jgi:hypothetical protein
MIYSLVNTDDFDVEIYDNLDDLLTFMESTFDGDIEITTLNSDDYHTYRPTVVEILLEENQAVDVYEDNLLTFVVKKHD